jgi:phenylpropionate dioxygenase-like ring-hydroxylating dioxygenase large terminal subunit
MIAQPPAEQNQLADLVTPDRVHRRLYTDPDLFAAEMGRLFEQGWVFVGHASEVPFTGDYKTVWLGRQPAIFARHADGQVYVLMNRCSHRASLVCREPQGNSSYFRCIYHGWTYNTRGDLIGVPFRAGYGDDFDESRLGLLRAPRTASYRDFVFASLSPDGESLLDYLGRAREYLDLCLDRAPEGEIVVRSGVHRYEYPANWKLQLENWLDGYHPNFTHQTAFDAVRKRGGKPGSVEGSPGHSRSLPRGHGLLDYTGARGGYQADLARNDPQFMPRLEARLGAEQAAEVMRRDVQVLVFPNLFLQEDRQHFRVVRPIAVDRTEVCAYPYTLAGASDEFNAHMVQTLAWWSSPAGFGQPDDLEAFARCQAGLQVTEAEWVLFNRGLARERTEGDDERVGDLTDEVPQRGIYREWLRRMAGTPAPAGV